MAQKLGKSRTVDHRVAVADSDARRGAEPMSAGRHYREVDAPADRPAGRPEENAGARREVAQGGDDHAQGRAEGNRQGQARAGRRPFVFAFRRRPRRSTSASASRRPGSTRARSSSARRHHPRAARLSAARAADAAPVTAEVARRSQPRIKACHVGQTSGRKPTRIRGSCGHRSGSPKPGAWSLNLVG